MAKKNKPEARDFTAQVLELVRELSFNIPKDADAFDIAQRAAAYARVDKTQRSATQRELIVAGASVLFDDYRARTSMLTQSAE